MSRNRRNVYVMGKLLYFLESFSPDQRLDFLLRAVVEVSVVDVRPASTQQPALSAPSKRPRSGMVRSRATGRRAAR
jgi:hypothetical protein